MCCCFVLPVISLFGHLVLLAISFSVSLRLVLLSVPIVFTCSPSCCLVEWAKCAAVIYTVVSLRPVPTILSNFLSIYIQMPKVHYELFFLYLFLYWFVFSFLCSQFSPLVPSFVIMSVFFLQYFLMSPYCLHYCQTTLTCFYSSLFLYWKIKCCVQFWTNIHLFSVSNSVFQNNYVCTLYFLKSVFTALWGWFFH